MRCFSTVFFSPSIPISTRSHNHKCIRMRVFIHLFSREFDWIFINFVIFLTSFDFRPRFEGFLNYPYFKINIKLRFSVSAQWFSRYCTRCCLGCSLNSCVTAPSPAAIVLQVIHVLISSLEWMPIALKHHNFMHMFGWILLSTPPFQIFTFSTRVFSLNLLYMFVLFKRIHMYTFTLV